MLSPWSTTHVIQPTGRSTSSTTYLGLNLRNPIVASPSPLTGTIDGLGRLVAAGVGAVVLPSILEEQVWNEAARRLERMPDGIGSLDRVASRRPAAPGAVDDAAGGLELIREAAAAFDVPVIASLNGGAAGGWPTYAHALQQAGAAAIELNIYEIPAEAARSARAVEDRHLEILQTVKSVVTIPVAVKLAPWLTAPGELAARLVEAGADGLVLFNRFLQPDIDLERLAVVPRLELSTAVESRMPMTWIALLRGRLPASLAATTGVEDATDVVKYLLAGADVVMTASAVLRHGPEYAAELIGGLEDWLAANDHATVGEIRGLLRTALGEDAAAKRAAYIDVLLVRDPALRLSHYAAAMPDFGRSFRAEWLLDPNVTYLNHGTVGATPRRVLEHQRAIVDEIERHPARFMLRELADHTGTAGGERRLRKAAEAVGAFVGVPGDELVFVENITAAANAVLRSFPFSAGDEVAVTNLGYGGVTNAAAYATRTSGATLRTIALPPPGAPRDAYVDAVAAGSGRGRGCWSSTTSPRRPRWCCRSPRSRRSATSAACSCSRTVRTCPATSTSTSMRSASTGTRRTSTSGPGRHAARASCGRPRSTARRCTPPSSRGASTTAWRPSSTSSARATRRRSSPRRSRSTCCARSAATAAWRPSTGTTTTWPAGPARFSPSAGAPPSRPPTSSWERWSPFPCRPGSAPMRYASRRRSTGTGSRCPFLAGADGLSVRVSAQVYCGREDVEQLADAVAALGLTDQARAVGGRARSQGWARRRSRRRARLGALPSSTCSIASLTSSSERSAWNTLRQAAAVQLEDLLEVAVRADDRAADPRPPRTVSKIGTLDLVVGRQPDADQVPPRASEPMRLLERRSG